MVPANPLRPVAGPSRYSNKCLTVTNYDAAGTRTPVVIWMKSLHFPLPVWTAASSQPIALTALVSIFLSFKYPIKSAVTTLILSTYNLTWIWISCFNYILDIMFYGYYFVGEIYCRILSSENFLIIFAVKYKAATTSLTGFNTSSSALLTTFSRDFTSIYHFG